MAKKKTKRPSHTPGCWEQFGYMKGKRIPVGVLNEEQNVRIADVGDRGMSAAEMKANARIITAAPDLLSACVAALDLLSDKYHAEDGPTGKLLRDAIGKAVS